MLEPVKQIYSEALTQSLERVRLAKLKLTIGTRVLKRAGLVWQTRTVERILQKAIEILQLRKRKNKHCLKRKNM